MPPSTYLCPSYTSYTCNPLFICTYTTTFHPSLPLLCMALTTNYRGDYNILSSFFRSHIDIAATLRRAARRRKRRWRASSYNLTDKLLAHA